MRVSYPELTPAEEIGNDIAQRFSDGTPFLHVQGLPILGETAQRDAFIISVASTVGELTLTGGTHGSELWQLDSFTSPSTRQIPFHTDSPFYESPEQVVSFWSIRSSAQGGENIILPVTSLVDWMTDQPQHAGLLEELNSREVSFAFKGNRAAGTILQPDARTVRYDHKYIDSPNTELGLRFTKALNEISMLAYHVKLGEGDALFFNNHTTLHARAPYSDSSRLSIRARMNTGR